MQQEKKRSAKLLLWLIPVVLIAAIAVVLVLGGFFSKGPLYWNVDRMEYVRQDRQPDQEGIYWVRFVRDGEVVELAVADSRLVAAIDARNVMQLELDRNNRVTGVKDPEDLTAVARKLYVEKTDGNTVFANGSMAFNGKDHTLSLTEKTKIYDVMPGTQSFGTQLQPQDLSLADAFVAYADPAGQITQVFVTARSGSANIYWRTERKWDSETKMTARLPDETGTYTVEFCCNGALKTLKCKDVAIVTQIDRASVGEAAFCFIIDEDGYITQVRDIRAGAHGVQVCTGYVVRSVEGDTFTAANPESTMVTYTAALPDTCGIYDVSEAAIRDGRMGQAVEGLKPGDKVYVWADVDGTPLSVYVRHRNLDVPAYRIYPVNCYSTSVKQTTRTPNEEGWYEIDVIKVGEVGVKTYRTKDKELVNFLDSNTTTQIVGLQLDGDVITQVYSSTSIYGGSVVYKGRYVVNVVGCIMTVQRIGKGGTAPFLMLTPQCKVYDLTGTAPLGSETQLRPGDVVEAQSDLFGQIVAVFVTRRLG